jgi:hypothetical protein
MSSTLKADKQNSHLKVFLCHGSEDTSVVEEIYYRLREDGVEAINQ